MQEKWNQFVYYLCETQKNNAKEPEYHSTIEAQLQLLGWMKYKDEICHKPNLPIGNNGSKDGQKQTIVTIPPTAPQKQNSDPTKPKHQHDKNQYSISADGISFAVCSQWGIGNTPKIVDLAKKLGHAITYNIK